MPAQPRPGAETPDRLWQLANYDPLFYVALMAQAGYIEEAWKAGPPPAPIKPFIPPRPIPPYPVIPANTGQFVGVTTSDF